MAITIGIYNRKGGVGKTHSTINIGAALAMKGYSVLEIDGESQMSLTGFFLSPDENYYDLGRLKEEVVTLPKVLTGKKQIEDAIITITYSMKRKIFELNRFKQLECSLDIIPCGPQMDSMEFEDDDMKGAFSLKDALEPIQNDYDFILIDFPPAYSDATHILQIACDYILIPGELEENDCLTGFTRIEEDIEELHKYELNPDIEILGMFYTKAKLYKGRVKKYYDDILEDKDYLKLFDTCIRDDGAGNAIMKDKHQPMVVCAPRSNATLDYIALTNEILERFGIR